MLTAGLFQPSLQDPVVQVVSTEDRLQYVISWPAQSGAIGYHVYGGFDPVHIRSLISGPSPLPATQTAFTFNAPFYPPGQIAYFWVGMDSQGGPTFINDIGSYAMATGQLSTFNNTDRFSDTSIALMAPEDSLYYVEEIRRRAKAILEDTGEEIDLFMKQWRGLPDPTGQDELGLDPNYQSMSRDDRTYGTGFYPGYFPSIRMLMRFGNLPASQLDYQPYGMRPLLQNEAWTVWDPILHEGDLIVRARTGQRYVVNSAAFGNWRGIPITQRMTLQIVAPTSPLQKVTNPDVIAKWGLINSVSYSRVGFGIIGALGGGPDFLIL